MEKRVFVLSLCVLLLLCALVGCANKENYDVDWMIGKTSSKIIDKYGAFDCVTMDASEEGLYKNCKFASFDAETDVGSIDVDSLDCRVTSLSSDVGSIKGKLCGKLEDYTVSCRKDMGSCNISDRVGGDKILKVSTSVGSINITFTESE